MFLKLWRFLFGGCEHKWATKQIVDVFPEASAKLPIGKKYTMHCSKCGELKFKRDF